MEKCLYTDQSVMIVLKRKQRINVKLLNVAGGNEKKDWRPEPKTQIL